MSTNIINVAERIKDLNRQYLGELKASRDILAATDGARADLDAASKNFNDAKQLVVDTRQLQATKTSAYQNLLDRDSEQQGRLNKLKQALTELNAPLPLLPPIVVNPKKGDQSSAEKSTAAPAA